MLDPVLDRLSGFLTWGMFVCVQTRFGTTMHVTDTTVLYLLFAQLMKVCRSVRLLFCRGLQCYLQMLSHKCNRGTDEFMSLSRNNCPSLVSCLDSQVNLQQQSNQGSSSQGRDKLSQISITTTQLCGPKIGNKSNNNVLPTNKAKPVG